jgi:hypothetical protein
MIAQCYLGVSRRWEKQQRQENRAAFSPAYPLRRSPRGGKTRLPA